MPAAANMLQTSPRRRSATSPRRARAARLSPAMMTGERRRRSRNAGGGRGRREQWPRTATPTRRRASACSLPLLAQQRLSLPTVIVPPARRRSTHAAEGGRSAPIARPTARRRSRRQPVRDARSQRRPRSSSSQAAGSSIASTATAPTTGRADAPRRRSVTAEGVGPPDCPATRLVAQTRGRPSRRPPP